MSSAHMATKLLFETIYKFTVVQNLHKTSVARVWFCYWLCEAVLVVKSKMRNGF
jgi:hypothetical protein